MWWPQSHVPCPATSHTPSPCHHLLCAIISRQSSANSLFYYIPPREKKLLASNLTTPNLFVAFFLPPPLFAFCFNNSALFGAVALARSLGFRAFICSCLVRSVGLAPRTHALPSPNHSFSLYVPLLPAPTRFNYAAHLLSALQLPKEGEKCLNTPFDGQNSWPVS